MFLLYRKVKKFLRYFIPANRPYMDTKFRDENKALRQYLANQNKKLEPQNKQLELQNEQLHFQKQQLEFLGKQLSDQKNILDELLKANREHLKEMNEIKLYIGQELKRRDNWGKRWAEIAREAKGRQVWVIKCPAPEDATKIRWGDYHFAVSLKKYLDRLNIFSIVDTKEDWDCEEKADVVLVLRGYCFFRPDRRNPKCLYILWNISHPDMVTDQEYQLYDAVCVSSRFYAGQLQKKLNVDVWPLLQCTDTELFYPLEEDIEKKGRDYIFVGNSRGVARKSVMWAIENGLSLHVWGSGWNAILKDHMDLLEAPFIENREIPDLYRASRVILNDHWQDMLDYQYINNRIFDALACGIPVISDTCEELREIFPDAVLHYRNKEEFDACVRQVENNYDEIRRRVLAQSKVIKEEYSFEVRARELVEIAKSEFYKKSENSDSIL